MAQQDVPKIGFRSIQLLKEQTLGIGSYGSVCKALCDMASCAAKIMHPTLFDPNAHQRIERQREYRLPISRFMQECEFMSAIRHPNIVQYLGTHQDPETRLPVLLMELMDYNLTHFLESSQNAVPYHIQVSFCHDITSAISYLHSNGITHRDLSSNNVLLRGNVKAKVTDFGMAKLGDINPRATRVSFTLCPGTEVYMPPEAVKDKPVYTAKIDCFSIGTLIIQILTRCFPDPGERFRTIQIDDPRYPGGTADVRVSEIERRQNHISQVDPNHPLLPIALDCLKDSDVDRPSAQELCDRVAALKETPQFTESVEKAKKRLELGEEEIRKLRQQIQDQDDIIQQKDDIIREKEQTIQAGQQDCQQLRDTITERDQLIERRQSTQGNITLRWREGKKAPFKMSRVVNTIVDNEMVYFMTGTQTIYAYDSTDETWNQFPECETKKFSLAVVDNLITTIGGTDINHKVTNQLFCFTGEGKSKKWREEFQPMPTKRSSSIVLYTGKALIVAGGVGQRGMLVRTVEVMDVFTQEWSSAKHLAEPLSNASITTCLIYDRVCIAGGVMESGATRSVYTCTLTDLFLSCRSRNLGERLAQSLLLTRPPRSTVWTKVADLPVVRSTCVTHQDRLLAIGGYDSTNGSPTSDVRIYHPTSNTWEVISKMNISRDWCFAAVLPTNEIMVVGGRTTISLYSETDSVEIATIV